MTRTVRIAVILIVTAAALIISGCPSPVNIVSDGGQEPYQTTAEVSFDASRGVVVFTEEDGTETPVVVQGENGDDGPVDLIDYVVLDDGDDAGRFSGNVRRIRCIVIGRRSDGKSGVWVIYRGGGVVVLPNEDNVKDSALMEMVEVEGSPYLGDEWVYDAKAISSDGRMIIGQLSRPDGWIWLSDEAPKPSIGVFWSIYEVDDKLIISRARPILRMYEPEPDTSLSRHMWRHRNRYSDWMDRLKEMLQAFFLDISWNYLEDVDGFVPADKVEGGIPEGFYVVAGPDKYGTDAWAWLTLRSVENIVDAPVVELPKNNPPWEVTGPTKRQYLKKGDTFNLEVSDLNDPPNVYYAPDGPFDPDGDNVIFEVIAVSIEPDPGFKPEATAVNGVFSMVWNPVYDGTQHQILFRVKTSDGTDETLSEPVIRVVVY